MSLFLNSCNFSAGSYPYAERYKLNYKESEIIIAINEFKQINSEYIVPKEIGLIDGKSDDPDDKWYHVYFYYPKENEIVYTWIRSSLSSNKNSTFALVGINKGTSIGNWRRINRDFDSHENELNKKKFEERILNKINSLLEK